MAWLLDTNVWIHYLRDSLPEIRQRLAAHARDEIVTCAIVRAELLHGALKYGNAERRTSVVRETLSPFRSLSFDEAAADCYAEIRHRLELNGERIGPQDLMIAAICLTQDCVLVTGNRREFTRVPALRVEDWQTL